MKNINMFLAALAFTTGAWAANPKPFTVPEIQSWKGGEGSFLVTDATDIVVKAGSEAEQIAGQFAKGWKSLTGSPLNVTYGKPGKEDISFVIKPSKKANPESYTINIDSKGIRVTAPTVAGLRYGASTLLQMIDGSGADGFPYGAIVDEPSYPFRGFMIDAGRKYIPLDYLYNLVDILSYYKMNVLHVHLNDNGFKYFFDNDWSKTQAAFRLESDKFPGLTARDGSYSKKEFRDFIKYAETKGVEIIPEIDFPAHSLAFIRYMPEIGSNDDLYGGDHLNLAEPKTYEFLDTLIAEYIGGENPVFAGKRFHIGTDEYSNRDSLVVEQFRGLTDRYIKYTESFGKQPVVWGALTHAAGKTPVKSDGVLMYSWYAGYANPKDMIDQGYKMVSIPDGWVYIVPNAGYYYDYLNTEKLYKEYTPAILGAGFDMGEDNPAIEGGMFAVWNDHPNNGITVQDIHHRVMDALPVMSAKTWNGSKVSVPYEQFEEKSSRLSEAPGINLLARYDTGGAPVLSQTEVLPGSTLAIPEVGYAYVVEFDVDGADEQPGTKLFESPNAIFWLSDPITGNMGYSREGHLYSFRQNIRQGEKLHVRVEGDNKHTALYVNGHLVDDMNVRWKSYNEGKNKMAEVRTIIFPLEKAGDFKSKITNLKVTQTPR